MLSLDPVTQQAAFEIHASQWRDGSLIAEERRVLTSNLYFRGELVMMLERAGFASVQVRGQYNDQEPCPADEFLVYIATRATPSFRPAPAGSSPRRCPRGAACSQLSQSRGCSPRPVGIPLERGPVVELVGEWGSRVMASSKARSPGAMTGSRSIRNGS
jgi:hypothetical protein